MRYVCGVLRVYLVLAVLSVFTLWGVPAYSHFKHIHHPGCKHDHRYHKHEKKHEWLKKKHLRWCQNHLKDFGRKHNKKFLERWKERCPAGEEPEDPTCHPAETFHVSYVAKETFQWPFKNGCGRKDFRNMHNNRWALWTKGIYTFNIADLESLRKVQLQSETVKMMVVVDSMDDVKIKNLKISLNGFEGKPIDLNSVDVRKVSTFRVTGENRNKYGKKHKGDDFDYGYLVELTFHLERFIFAVNYSAADILRLSKTATFKVIPNRRVLRSSQVTLTLDGVNPANCPPPPPVCTCNGYDPSQTQCGALGADSCGNPGVCGPPGTLNCEPPPPPVCNCNNYDPASTQCGQMGADSCGNPGVCGPPGTLNCEPPPPPAPPIVTITNTSVGSLTNISDVSIEFAADVPATFQCSLDGAAYADCASPYTRTALSDGPHHFSVIGYNAGGPSAPAFFDWSIDTTAPLTSLDSIVPNASLTDQTQITFTFSSNEIATFQCRLDTMTFVDCASPYTASNLLDGPHIFYVRATDFAGNTGPEVGHAWTVKTNAPTVQITSVVPNTNPSNISMRTYTFTGSADTSSFVCSLDGSVDFACASPYAWMGITDGSHIFRVKSVDALNKKSTPDSESFTIDTVAPIVTIVSAVPGQSPTSSNSISISFASDDAASFMCQLDGMAAVTCTSPIDIGALADGLHNFQVVGTDAAGNVSAPAVYGWTVDTLAPVLQITSVNPAGFLINQNNLTLNFSVSEPSTVTCVLDSGTPSDCSSGSISYSNLSDGMHVVALTPRDEANNVGSTVTYSFTVDTTAPVVTITSVTPSESLTNSTNASFTFISSESALFRCSLDGSAYVACTSPFSYTGLADGTHTFSVEGTDVAGNLSAAAATYSWTVDTSSPNVVITGHTPVDSPTNIQSMSLTFVSSEAGTFSCQLDSLSWESCSSPANYNGLADGTHTFRVLATDLAGNTSPSAASYTWVIDTLAPTTTITNNSVTESPTDATSITLHFTANEASTFQCRLDSGAWTSCLSPVTYNGLSPGGHTVNIRATDLAGNVDTTGVSFSWAITAPPLILTPATPAVQSISQTSARLVWTSNLPANTQGAIRVGSTGAFTFTTVDPTMSTNHSVTFTGLAPNTLYNVYGISNDGFQTVSTPIFSFRTLR